VRRWGVFLLAYAGLSSAAVFAAPQFGRQALPCLKREGAVIAMHSPLYCVLNRQYASPEMAQPADALGRHMAEAYPGTITLLLDAGFPFLDGFPLLPHLSHDDGQKLDLSFYYQDEGQPLRGQTRSPLGYFAFEQPAGGDACPKRLLTLRWNMRPLQPWMRGYALDGPRTAEAMRFLTRAPEVEKIFLEPHLVQTLGVAHSKVRFQGCRAARHDDHIHFQIRAQDV